jgi:hypothetical protein
MLPPPLASMCGISYFSDEEDAAKVGIDDVVPLLGTVFVEGLLNGDPCIVERHVQLAELLNGLVDEGLYVAFIAYIRPDIEAFSAA